jgi:hypothetical protein
LLSSGNPDFLQEFGDKHMLFQILKKT